MKRRLVFSFLGITSVVLLLLAIPTAYLLRSVAAEESKEVLRRQADYVVSRLAEIDTENPALPFLIDDAVPSDASALVRLTNGRSFRVHPEPIPPVITGSSVGSSGVRVDLSTGDRDVRERVRGAMVVLLGLGVAGLLATWLLAQTEARRLGQPLEALSATAASLGSGDFSVVVPRSGIPEYDTLAVTLDATASQIAELVRAERQFNTDASHQLRSALTGLRLRIESLTLTDDDEIREEASAALEQVDRLSDTVNDLLRMSRTGRAGVASRYDLRALMSNHLQDVSVLLKRERRRLLAPDGPAVFVEGAPGAVGQAIDILLNNAATHGRGTVTVTVAAKDDRVELRVRDEGKIDIHDPAAFFVQRDQGGPHGIGLRLARRLIESEGGTLDLASSSPTTFRIRLPLADELDLLDDEVGATTQR